jgi:hypothetical protein
MALPPLTSWRRGWIGMFLALVVTLILLHPPIAASAPAEASDPVSDAALQLVQVSVDPNTALNQQAVATLIDHVLGAKQANRQYTLPKSQGCTGAFFEFDTKISFPRFVEYSYNPSIPAAVSRPSSLRYSIWVNQKGAHQVLPASWRPIPAAGSPIIIHGMQREADSPDLNTGVYHEYDLKRLLVFVNYKGRQALISVSKQMGTSNVGKKGFTLGEDSDWNYYYSDEPGTTKKGMGWAKSYIYDYFSVGVYVEPTPGQPMTRSAVFQWLRAGWSGMNFVRPNHILSGMKRFANGFTAVLESPRLPGSGQIVSAYQSLLQLSTSDLLQRYAALQQGLRSSALRLGKTSKSEPLEHKSFAHLSREQMAEELMVDYIRVALGKRSAMAKEPSLAALVP